VALQDEKQTAEILGIKPNTLAKWRLTGAGPKFARVGSAIRYDPKDVEAWLESRKVQSTSEAA
jgi:predicted DNA-binding transcriptional regulator AlpA